MADTTRRIPSVCAPVRANAFVETMTAERYVPIEALKHAVRSHETAAVLWGDPTKASHLILCEGIDRAASLALSRRAEIGLHEIAVRAVLVRGGSP